MKSLHAFIKITTILLVLIFSACEELPDFSDNIFETPLEDQIPQITSLPDPLINGSSVIFNWEGNEFALEFSYKLTSLSFGDPVPQFYLDWSDWNNEASFSIDNLDEGDYAFHVKSRIDLIEQDEATTINFKIDAITVPALRIYPLNQIVREGETFEIYIYAENIQNGEIAGSQIELHFNTSLLEYIEDVNNCGTDNDIFCPQLDEGSMTLVNWNINGIFEDNTPLAHLSFTKLGNESEDIIIYDGGTILRNSNNENINIDSFYNGRIEVGE